MKLFMAILAGSLMMSAFAYEDKFAGVDQYGKGCDLAINLPLEQLENGQYNVSLRVSADSKRIKFKSEMKSYRGKSYLEVMELTSGIPMFGKRRALTVYFDAQGNPASYFYTLATDGFNSKILKQIDCKLN